MSRVSKVSFNSTSLGTNKKFFKKRSLMIATAVAGVLLGSSAAFADNVIITQDKTFTSPVDLNGGSYISSRGDWTVSGPVNISVPTTIEVGDGGILDSSITFQAVPRTTTFSGLVNDAGNTITIVNTANSWNTSHSFPTFDNVFKGVYFSGTASTLTGNYIVTPGAMLMDLFWKTGGATPVQKSVVPANKIKLETDNNVSGSGPMMGIITDTDVTIDSAGMPKVEMAATASALGNYGFYVNTASATTSKAPTVSIPGITLANQQLSVSSFSAGAGILSPVTGAGSSAVSFSLTGANTINLMNGTLNITGGITMPTDGTASLTIKGNSGGTVVFAGNKVSDINKIDDYFLSNLTLQSANTVVDTGKSLRASTLNLSGGMLTLKGSLKLNSADTLNVSGINTIFGSGSASSIVLQGTTLNPVNFNLNNSSDLMNVSSPLSGNTGFVKNGPGTLLLSGNSGGTVQLSGPVVVNAGTLELANSNALGTAGTLTLASNTRLKLDQSTTYVAGLKEYYTNATGSTGTMNTETGASTLGARLAYVPGTTTPPSDNTLATNPAMAWITPPAMSATSTWSYRGQVLVLDSGNGTGSLALMENFDDIVTIIIDGKTYINNQYGASDGDSWSTPHSMFVEGLSAGWHSIDIRVSNGSGAGGAWTQANSTWNYPQYNLGDSNTSNAKGVLIIQNPGSNPGDNFLNYLTGPNAGFAMDSGSMNLFRITGQTGQELDLKRDITVNDSAIIDISDGNNLNHKIKSLAVTATGSNELKIAGPTSGAINAVTVANVTLGGTEGGSLIISGSGKMNISKIVETNTNGKNLIVRNTGGVVFTNTASAAADKNKITNTSIKVEGGRVTDQASSTASTVDPLAGVTVNVTSAGGSLRLTTGGGNAATNFTPNLLLSATGRLEYVNPGGNTSATYAGNLDAGGFGLTIDVSQNGTLTISTPIANGNTLDFTGKGTTILAAANTISYLTTITDGTVALKNASYAVNRYIDLKGGVLRNDLDNQIPPGPSATNDTTKSLPSVYFNLFGGTYDLNNKSETIEGNCWSDGIVLAKGEIKNTGGTTTGLTLTSLAKQDYQTFDGALGTVKISSKIILTPAASSSGSDGLWTDINPNSPTDKKTVSASNPYIVPIDTGTLWFANTNGTVNNANNQGNVLNNVQFVVSSSGILRADGGKISGGTQSAISTGSSGASSFNNKVILTGNGTFMVGGTNFVASSATRAFDARLYNGSTGSTDSPEEIMALLDGTIPTVAKTWANTVQTPDDGAATFRSIFGALPLGQTVFSAIFSGYFIAPSTGAYTFYINKQDDIGSMYFDANSNGIFDSNERLIGMDGFVADNGESAASKKTVNLVQGGIYRFAFSVDNNGANNASLGIRYQAPNGSLGDLNPSTNNAGFYSGMSPEASTTNSQYTNVDVIVKASDTGTVHSFGYAKINKLDVSVGTTVNAAGPAGSRAFFVNTNLNSASGNGTVTYGGSSGTIYLGRISGGSSSPWTISLNGTSLANHIGIGPVLPGDASDPALTNTTIEIIGTSTLDLASGAKNPLLGVKGIVASSGTGAIRVVNGFNAAMSTASAVATIDANVTQAANLLLDHSGTNADTFGTGTSTWTYTTAAPGTLTANISEGTLNLNHKIVESTAANLSIIKDGPGTLVLGGSQANTYSGNISGNAGTSTISTLVLNGVLGLNKSSGLAVHNVEIRGGTLKLLASNQIPTSGETFNITNGAFDIGGFNQSIDVVTMPSTALATDTGQVTNSNPTVGALTVTNKLSQSSSGNLKVSAKMANKNVVFEWTSTGANGVIWLANNTPGTNANDFTGRTVSLTSGQNFRIEGGALDDPTKTANAFNNGTINLKDGGLLIFSGTTATGYRSGQLTTTNVLLDSTTDQVSKIKAEGVNLTAGTLTVPLINDTRTLELIPPSVGISGKAGFNYTNITGAGTFTTKGGTSIYDLNLGKVTVASNTGVTINVLSTGATIFTPDSNLNNATVNVKWGGKVRLIGGSLGASAVNILGPEVGAEPGSPQSFPGTIQFSNNTTTGTNFTGSFNLLGGIIEHTGSTSDTYTNPIGSTASPYIYDLIVNANSGELKLNGAIVINSANKMIKSGPAQLTLTSLSNNIPELDVNSGTLLLSVDDPDFQALGSAGNLVINNGTVRYDSNIYYPQLNPNTTVTMNGGTLDLGTNEFGSQQTLNNLVLNSGVIKNGTLTINSPTLLVESNFGGTTRISSKINMPDSTSIQVNKGTLSLENKDNVFKAGTVYNVNAGGQLAMIAYPNGASTLGGNGLITLNGGSNLSEAAKLGISGKSGVYLAGGLSYDIYTDVDPTTTSYIDLSMDAMMPYWNHKAGDSVTQVYADALSPFVGHTPAGSGIAGQLSYTSNLGGTGGGGISSNNFLQNSVAPFTTGRTNDVTAKFYGQFDAGKDGGDYKFNIYSDDVGLMFMNLASPGQPVNWVQITYVNNFGNGVYTAPISLTSGLHDIMFVYANGAGNADLYMRYQKPGSTVTTLVPSNVLYSEASVINNPINVSGSVQLNLSGAARFGPLTSTTDSQIFLANGTLDQANTVTTLNGTTSMFSNGQMTLGRITGSGSFIKEGLCTLVLEGVTEGQTDPTDVAGGIYISQGPTNNGSALSLLKSADEKITVPITLGNNVFYTSERTNMDLSKIVTAYGGNLSINLNFDGITQSGASQAYIPSGVQKGTINFVSTADFTGYNDMKFGSLSTLNLNTSGNSTTSAQTQTISTNIIMSEPGMVTINNNSQNIVGTSLYSNQVNFAGTISADDYADKYLRFTGNSPLALTKSFPGNVIIQTGTMYNGSTTGSTNTAKPTTIYLAGDTSVIGAEGRTLEIRAGNLQIDETSDTVETNHIASGMNVNVYNGILSHKGKKNADGIETISQLHNYGKTTIDLVSGGEVIPVDNKTSFVHTLQIDKMYLDRTASLVFQANDDAMPFTTTDPMITMARVKFGQVSVDGGTTWVDPTDASVINAGGLLSAGAIAKSAANTYDFVTYNSTTGVQLLTGQNTVGSMSAMYNTSADADLAGLAANLKITTATGTAATTIPSEGSMTAPMFINSLELVNQSSGAINFNLGNNKMTILSGGLVFTGGSTGGLNINPNTTTAATDGTGSLTVRGGSENTLSINHFAYTGGTLGISAPIAEATEIPGKTNLSVSAIDRSRTVALRNVNSTFTGDVYANNVTLELSPSDNYGTSTDKSTSVVGDVRSGKTVILNNSTLRMNYTSTSIDGTNTYAPTLIVPFINVPFDIRVNSDSSMNLTTGQSGGQDVFLKFNKLTLAPDRTFTVQNSTRGKIAFDSLVLEGNGTWAGGATGQACTTYVNNITLTPTSIFTRTGSLNVWFSGDSTGTMPAGSKIILANTINGSYGYNMVIGNKAFSDAVELVVMPGANINLGTVDAKIPATTKFLPGAVLALEADVDVSKGAVVPLSPVSQLNFRASAYSDHVFDGIIISPTSVNANNPGIGVIQADVANATYGSNITILGPTLIGNSNGFTMKGTLSGSGKLFKYATTTMTFTGPQTFSGGFDIVNGTVNANAVGSLGLGLVTIRNTSTSSPTTLNLNIEGAATGTTGITVNSGQLRYNVNKAGGGSTLSATTSVPNYTRGPDFNNESVFPGNSQAGIVGQITFAGNITNVGSDSFYIGANGVIDGGETALPLLSRGVTGSTNNPTNIKLDPGAIISHTSSNISQATGAGMIQDLGVSGDLIFGLGANLNLYELNLGVGTAFRGISTNATGSRTLTNDYKVGNDSFKGSINVNTAGALNYPIILQGLNGNTLTVGNSDTQPVYFKKTNSTNTSVPCYINGNVIFNSFKNTFDPFSKFIVSGTTQLQLNSSSGSTGSLAGIPVEVTEGASVVVNQQTALDGPITVFSGGSLRLPQNPNNAATFSVGTETVAAITMKTGSFLYLQANATCSNQTGNGVATQLQLGTSFKTEPGVNIFILATNGNDTGTAKIDYLDEAMPDDAMFELRNYRRNQNATSYTSINPQKGLNGITLNATNVAGKMVGGILTHQNTPGYGMLPPPGVFTYELSAATNAANTTTNTPITISTVYLGANGGTLAASTTNTPNTYTFSYTSNTNSSSSGNISTFVRNLPYTINQFNIYTPVTNIPVDVANGYNRLATTGGSLNIGTTEDILGTARLGLVQLRRGVNLTGTSGGVPASINVKGNVDVSKISPLQIVTDGSRMVTGSILGISPDTATTAASDTFWHVDGKINVERGSGLIINCNGGGSNAQANLLTSLRSTHSLATVSANGTGLASEIAIENDSFLQFVAVQPSGVTSTDASSIVQKFHFTGSTASNTGFANFYISEAYVANVNDLNSLVFMNNVVFEDGAKVAIGTYGLDNASTGVLGAADARLTSTIKGTVTLTSLNDNDVKISSHSRTGYGFAFNKLTNANGTAGATSTLNLVKNTNVPFGNTNTALYDFQTTSGVSIFDLGANLNISSETGIRLMQSASASTNYPVSNTFDMAQGTSLQVAANDTLATTPAPVYARVKGLVTAHADADTSTTDLFLTGAQLLIGDAGTGADNRAGYAFFENVKVPNTATVELNAVDYQNDNKQINNIRVASNFSLAGASATTIQKFSYTGSAIVGNLSLAAGNVGPSTLYISQGTDAACKTTFAGSITGAVNPVFTGPGTLVVAPVSAIGLTPNLGGRTLAATAGTVQVGVANMNGNLSLTTGAVGKATVNTTIPTITMDAASSFETGANTVNVKTIAGAGALKVDKTLNLAAKDSGGTAISVGSLTLGASGKIDLADGLMVVNYATTSPIETIKQQVIAGRGQVGGFADGPWNGTTGITSSLVADTNANDFGYENMVLGYGDIPQMFFGIPSTVNGIDIDPGATAVVTTYTILGDANLDGMVNGDDFEILKVYYGMTSGAHWYECDFNYDGMVNGDDFELLKITFGSSLPAAAAAPAMVLQAPPSSMVVAVPEPGTISLLGIASLGLLSRRRRSAK